eukprot:TRINITY_DN11535_c0_g1_i1.p1 TRINITY_DN11535_c0_g1~~TRINITY_DN11535_c0_g1_i1.p1  ORF type:complete len:477 (-),score=26.17 TRINITY_DN11535_c0_g1_i1:159-1460(-)
MADGMVAVTPKATTISKDSPMKTIELERESELRFETEYNSQAFVKLISGTAEYFGTELAALREYSISGSKGAIFTYHGATLELYGNCHHYIANDTPMIFYQNIHETLEELRLKAANQSNLVGPRVLIVGKTDTGKSTLSKILLGYAARRNFRPVFADLDIGQGNITIPGMVAAAPIDRPVPFSLEEFTESPPLVYFVGNVSPSDCPDVYRTAIENVARDLQRKITLDDSARIGGLIINTCGWVEGLGLDIIRHAIKVLSVNVVLVMDNDRLLNTLTNDFRGQDIKFSKLPCSGGVVARDKIFRKKARLQRIREYFYGANGDLYPHSTVVSFNDVIIFKIGTPSQAPASALPLGEERKLGQLRLIEVIPSTEILNSILSVSHAKSADTVISSNLAGFVYVSDVSFEKQKITLLSPCPGPLPSRFLVMGNIQWLE